MKLTNDKPDYKDDPVGFVLTADTQFPDCPNCGTNGNTVHHADSTEEYPLLTCTVCGRVGEA